MVVFLLGEMRVNQEGMQHQTMLWNLSACLSVGLPKQIGSLGVVNLVSNLRKGAHKKIEENDFSRPFVRLLGLPSAKDLLRLSGETDPPIRISSPLLDSVALLDGLCRHAE